MNIDTPRTQELRDDLAGIASEAPIWKLFKKLDCRQLERELTAVTEQRDELLRYNEAFRKETLICADCDAISKGEYDQAIEQRDRLQKIVDEQCRVSSVCREYREQRDRLAEALARTRNMIQTHPEAAESCATEALQSLTTNEQ
jgi:hypothetical protein